MVRTIRTPNPQEQPTELGLDQVTTSNGDMVLEEIKAQYNIRNEIANCEVPVKVRMTFQKLCKLHYQAVWEKIFAQRNGLKPEEKLWTAIINDLEYQRRMVDCINMSLCNEAKLLMSGSGPVVSDED